MTFHLKAAVRAVPHQPRQQRRDRQPEGDRGRGPGPQPGRHRAVQVRRVGPGRPRHAGEEPRLLHQPASRYARRRRASLPARRPEPHRRRCARASCNWVDAVPLQQLTALSSDDSFTYVTSPTAGIPDFLAMNVAQAPPFDKHGGAPGRRLGARPRRRSATSPTSAPARPAWQEVPSGSPWFDGGDVYAGGPDIDKAKQLLADAGIHRTPEDQLPRPAAVPGAAEDRRGRARAAQGDRHRHGDRAGRRLGVVRPLQLKGDYQITSALPGAHDRSRQLLLARRAHGRRRQRDAVLEPRRSTPRSIAAAHETDDGQAQGAVRRDPRRSCSRTPR